MSLDHAETSMAASVSPTKASGEAPSASSAAGPDANNVASSSKLATATEAVDEAGHGPPKEATAEPESLAVPKAKKPQSSKPKKASGNTKDASSKACASLSSGESLRGGYIGIASSEPPAPGYLSAGGGTRRAFPENVLPFPLRTTGKLRTIGKAKEKEAPSGSQTSEEESSEEESGEEESDESIDLESSSEEGDDDSGAQQRRIERQKQRDLKASQESQIYVQSLRQSRLFYLASLLPIHARKGKSGFIYNQDIPASQLHGIEASAMGSHVLLPLGRVDIQAGPHIFSEVRLWEMRKESPVSHKADTSAKKASGSKPSGSKNKGKEKSTSDPASANRAANIVDTPAAERVTSSKTDSVKSSPSRPTSNAQKSASSTPTPSRPPTSSSQTPSSAPPKHPVPPSAAATAAVDRNLVERVNLRAAEVPGLRELLAVAARGAASPDQLREIGTVIQEVTRQMEAEGIKVQQPQARPTAPSPSASTSGATGSAAPTPQPAAPVDETAARPKPKAKPRKSAEVKKEKQTDVGGQAATIAIDQKASDVLSQQSADSVPSKEEVNTKTPSKPVPEGALNGGESKVSPPPRPPIIVLEYRELSSARFYLPLWSSVVTLRKKKVLSSQDDNGEELSEEPVQSQVEREDSQVELQFVAPLIGSDAAAAEVKMAPRPINMVLSGRDPNGSLWEAISRVPGVKAFDASGKIVEIPASESTTAASTAESNEGGAAAVARDVVNATQQGRQADQRSIAEIEQAILKATVALPPVRYLKISSRLPEGLSDHLADKFAPQSLSQQPVVTSTGKRRQAASVATFAPADLSFGINDASFDVSLSVGMDGLEAPKPRKKRNVATHNPDGTLKLCNYCKTNQTPMWRRGPDGPGTLCNACGSRWKMGRLDNQAKQTEAVKVEKDAKAGENGERGGGGGGGGGGTAAAPSLPTKARESGQPAASNQQTAMEVDRPVEGIAGEDQLGVTGASES